MTAQPDADRTIPIELERLRALQVDLEALYAQFSVAGWLPLEPVRDALERARS